MKDFEHLLFNKANSERILSVGGFIQGMKLGANYVEPELAILTPFPHQPHFWNSSAHPVVP